MKDQINKLIEISEYLEDNENVIQLKRLLGSLDDNSYILSVMGQFSAGKSSLINNIFGKQILPVHKTETTARITFIRYGKEEKVELFCFDGSVEEVSLDESLEMWQTGEKADLIERIESISISIPSDLLKNGLIIADTPGTNTIIDKHIELTEKLIANSDRVLYVLGKQITESDIKFVKAVEEYGTGVVFVRTYMDQIKRNEEDVEQTIEKEKAILSEISSEEMFFVSNEHDSEYYSEIYSLEAYISCVIADDISKSIQKSVASRAEIILKKQEGRILDRRIELNMILDNDKEIYQEKRKEILESLRRLENNLEQKRVNLQERYIKEQRNAKEELNNNKKAEEKKLIIKINNESESSLNSDYQRELGEMVREAYIRLRNGYVNCFDRIVRDNKVLFIEEMKQNKELSVFIPDMPDNLDETDLQMDSLKDRMVALKELQHGLQEELATIESNNQSLEMQSNEIEEERSSLKESIENIQEQLDAFPPYVARYITVKGDHSCEKGFKVVGNILDWATIFIPGPTWAKLGGKVLKGAETTAKTMKAIKAADAFADGARVLAKVAKAAESGKEVAKSAKNFEKGARVVVDTIDVVNKGKKAVLAGKLGVSDDSIRNSNEYLEPDFSPSVPEGHKPTLLDYIDIGYWFSKIGKNFDTPDTKVVDTEYENKYNTSKQAIEREMRLQARKEFEMRKIQEGIKNKEDENQLLKEINARKKRAAQTEIQELERELEYQKRIAAIKLIRNHYISAVSENLAHIEEYILTDIFAEIDEKMQKYIATYDFKIKADILVKKNELEKLDDKFNSSERADIEREMILCKKYSDYLESVEM